MKKELKKIKWEISVLDVIAVILFMFFGISLNGVERTIFGFGVFGGILFMVLKKIENDKNRNKKFNRT